MKTILVLEDDLDLLNDTGTMLKKNGFEVILCSSIERAKEVILKKRIFSLILTDLNLVTTGLEDDEILKSYGSMMAGWIFLTKYILSNNQYKNTKFVIRSAYIDEFEDYLKNSAEKSEKELIKSDICFQKKDDDELVINRIKQLLGEN